LLIDKKIRRALRFLASTWSCASTNSRRAACDSPTARAVTRLRSVALSVLTRRVRSRNFVHVLVLTVVGIDRVLATGAQPDTDFDDLVKARSIHCMVTTVFGCNRRDDIETRRCLSYGAVNSRHFDASVHWRPDSVFERYRHLANHGFCDHGFVTSDSPGSAP
jgi:hypothetical protein